MEEYFDIPSFLNRSLSFANRTIELWNQVPADALETLSCKSSNFRKKVRKAINKAK
jgi:hypothetical protein